MTANTNYQMCIRDRRRTVQIVERPGTQLIYIAVIVLAKQKTRVWDAPNKQKSPFRRQAGNGDFAEV